MDDALEARHVVGGANLGGQLQHAHEHRGHHLAHGRAVLLHQREVLLGIEVLHRHDGAADLLRGHAEAERSCMVEGRRRQVDALVLHAEQQREQRRHTVGRCLQRQAHERAGDALGLAGGARRVQHVGAGHPRLGQRRGGLRQHRRLVALVTRHGAVEHQPQRHARRVGDDLAGLVGLVLRRHVDLCRAVVDDVRELAAREAARARGVHRAGVVAAPDDLHVAVVVLHADRHVVARLHARGAQQVAHAVGGGIELGEGLGEAAAAHDDGGLVGLGVEERTGIHGRRR